MYGHVCETGGTRSTSPSSLKRFTFKDLLESQDRLEEWSKIYDCNKIKDPERRKVVLLRDLRGARLCCGLALLYVGV